MSVDKRLIPYIPFSIRSIRYQKYITYINLGTFQEYLRDLEHVQIDRQKNRMYKHFSTSLESIKKKEVTSMKVIYIK